jgi:hypothetical protein
LGISIEETNERAISIKDRFIFLLENEAVHRAWRKLIVDYQVSGVQVHDPRLVAAMLVHRIEDLLTFNLPDFRRYSGITALSPARRIRTVVSGEKRFCWWLRVVMNEVIRSARMVV